MTLATLRNRYSGRTVTVRPGPNGAISHRTYLRSLRALGPGPIGSPVGLLAYDRHGRPTGVIDRTDD